MEDILFRSLERILVVLAGAGSIYLGYRLFVQIPFQKDAEGSFKLPGGIEVVMSKIGPGAFFALFGSVILGMSLHSQITSKREIVASQPAEPGAPLVAQTVRRTWSGAGELAAANVQDSLDRKSELTRLRHDIGFLNQLEQRTMPTLEESERGAVGRGMRDVRLSLIEAHWGDDLGEWESFRDWVMNGDVTEEVPAALEAAVALYQHQS